MDVPSVEQFLANLEKSALLDAGQLAEARAAAAPCSDSQALAWSLIRQGLLSRWQANQLRKGQLEFHLGKYRLIDVAGQGGHGDRVPRPARDDEPPRGPEDRSPRGWTANPAAMERFLAEARAIAALDHPNIVQAYSVDNEGDRYYLVMEYVDGRDLQRFVEEEGPLDYDRAADAMRQAADGLAHAHGRGMIHCDIKPSNLLVNSQGTVKILDMGLARLTGRDEERPRDRRNRVLGTVDYMAPEQAMGSDRFDHRADIYSLGCTFYFLLTGHPPFPEGTLAQRIVKHQTQQPQSILARRPDAPRELVRICRKMMAKKPEDRFQSAEEVRQRLAAWDPESARPEAGRAAGRRRAGSGGMGSDHRPVQGAGRRRCRAPARHSHCRGPCPTALADRRLAGEVLPPAGRVLRSTVGYWACGLRLVGPAGHHDRRCGRGEVPRVATDSRIPGRRRGRGQ